jgi:hypothetical protein
MKTAKLIFGLQEVGLNLALSDLTGFTFAVSPQET